MAGLTDNTLLNAENISLFFGGIVALNDVSLDVVPGEILAIIGPNGAGKTSLLNCVNGLYRPNKGRIFFDGHEITKLKAHKRARLRMARTFQHVELFEGMSVLDNIKLGCILDIKSNFLGSFFRFGKSLREEMKARRELEEKVIDFLDLNHVREQPVSMLPHGLQKRVDLARAIALKPKILLLDEPMAGMNVEEKEDMASFFLDIHRDMKATIVWIEHDLSTVMNLSDRICVLKFGQRIALGTPDEVRNNPEVIEAYLGQEEDM
ncbi:MAG: ABC transporter ATP-binding protein [Deltaproteobacteria bacterium]|nr:ABC transporter ATP-binding protein [Deltaproteobacteria bacterium]